MLIVLRKYKEIQRGVVMKCIICKEEKNESIEHIIPEALGNKKLVTNRVCKECNSRLGSNIDDYLVNNFVVKLIRNDKKLFGKKGKNIKIFDGVEIDKKTSLKYTMKNNLPELNPQILYENGGVIKVVDKNIAKAKELFKKYLSRQGYTETQIEEKLCKDIFVGESILEPPVFEKKVIIDFKRFAIAAIKIAYEYTFKMLGESYLDDKIGGFFAKELYNMTKVDKEAITLSDELCKYIIYPISETEIDSLLATQRQDLSLFEPEVIYTIFFIRQNNDLYCILNLCMIDFLSFAIKVSENADLYTDKIFLTLVYRNGEVYTF